MSLKPPEIKEKDKTTENGNNITTESESTTLPEDQSSAEEEKISTSAAYEEKNWQEEAEKYGELYLRSTADLENVKNNLNKHGLEVIDTRISRRPSSAVKIVDDKQASSILTLVNKLDDLAYTQRVYANFDIPDDILQKQAV